MAAIIVTIRGEEAAPGRGDPIATFAMLAYSLPVRLRNAINPLVPPRPRQLAALGCVADRRPPRRKELPAVRPDLRDAEVLRSAPVALMAPDPSLSPTATDVRI